MEPLYPNHTFHTAHYPPKLGCAKLRPCTEEEIRQKNVNENYETAMDTTPEVGLSLAP